ncbi:hypothetical protein Syun_006214 [Stephania yunnanensis]|uniref:Uncharacterized protein n=1 Tax=Stephania yunnanensis TaxID=152371 RepID=A0AAP0KXL7_9MAGN
MVVGVMYVTRNAQVYVLKITILILFAFFINQENNIGASSFMFVMVVGLDFQFLMHFILLFV